ncbi:SCO family protein [Streptomyces sp. NPDC004539]|uniref:SCO family protein n=1 Tax=Streptomyces sp. NPDC004539 TaxID=3154280 RepID=UPI0033B867CE
MLSKPSQRKKTYAATALLAAALLTLSACGSEDGSSSVASVVDEGGNTTEQAAIVLDQPFTKPNLVLTDTKGAKYDLRAATKGQPTLLYFGYTHCPDVCPLTMSNIAVAKSKLPKAQQDELKVVFVTTDPARDTPAALASWLKGIDPQAVGLTGDFATIQAAARTVGITIEPPHKDKNGKMVSTHGTQVVAFSPKTDGGYVLYTESATVDDYIKDLPKLVQGAKP